MCVRARRILTSGPVGHAADSGSVLFIGNSFTYGAGSPVRYYRSQTVTDLNNEGIGGVPALFKVFTQQVGLTFDVAVETRGGAGIDFHVKEKKAEISSRAWDVVVANGHSLVDQEKPGDPEKHIAASYDKAAAGAGAKVVPVGEAFNRAMAAGLADTNPYDGIDAGKIDIWTNDSYHASAYGYYLEALMVFGRVTGRDPRSLGSDECSGMELGLSGAQVTKLQQIAFDELSALGPITPNPKTTRGRAGRCPAN